MEIESIQTRNMTVGNQQLTDMESFQTTNLILNSCFRLADYADYVDNPTSGNEYNSVNRWRARRANSRPCRIGRSTIDSPNAPNCLYMRRNNGDPYTDAFAVQQQIESFNIYPVYNQKLTLSFYLRADEEWYPDWGTSSVKIAVSSALNESIAIGATGTNETVLMQEDISIPDSSNAWQLYVFTTDIPVPANSQTMYIKFLFGTSSAAGVENQVLRLGDVKLEPGEDRIKYIPMPLTFEQLLCNRYYYSDDGPNFHTMNADNDAGDKRGNMRFPVRMRTTPTITLGTTSGTIIVQGVDPLGILFGGSNINAYGYTASFTADAEL